MTFAFLPLIGIDIGASAIKIAEVGGSGSSRKLKALGMELLAPDAIADGVIQDVEVVETALVSLLQKLNINPLGRRAAVAMPSSRVEIKRVLVEPSKGDLDEVMAHEAEQHFQGDIADLSFQYQELVGWSEAAGKVPILMVGAQRESVDQVIDLIKSVGLRTGVIDCEPLCLLNAMEFSAPNTSKLTAIIDVGSTSSQLALSFQGQILFTRGISIGSTEYTRRIMQELGIDLDSAEAMKLAVSHGYAHTPEPIQALFAALNDSLISEIHSLLQVYFESSLPIPGVQGLSQLYLAGGGARILGLGEAIGRALQVPVQVLNPFNRLKIASKRFDLEYIVNQGHIYSVAVGLALRKHSDDKN